MQFNNAIPIYLQIMDSIKREIATGALPPGERVESVRSLSEKYEVNLNTMQRACAELEKLGLIQTVRGVGSFVTDDHKVIDSMKEEMSAMLIRDFVAGMEGIGYTKGEIAQFVRKVLEV